MARMIGVSPGNYAYHEKAEADHGIVPPRQMLNSLRWEMQLLGHNNKANEKPVKRDRTPFELAEGAPKHPGATNQDYRYDPAKKVSVHKSWWDNPEATEPVITPAQEPLEPDLQLPTWSELTYEQQQAFINGDNSVRYREETAEERERLEAAAPVKKTFNYANVPEHIRKRYNKGDN